MRCDGRATAVAGARRAVAGDRSSGVDPNQWLVGIFLRSNVEDLRQQVASRIESAACGWPSCCSGRISEQPLPYRIQRSEHHGATVFVLSGELDSQHAAQLAELLALESAGRILLDLHDITL